MREGGFSTPLCHYAIILWPSGITKNYLTAVEILATRYLTKEPNLLFPDHWPASLSLTPQKLTGALYLPLGDWLGPKWKLRNVEFGGEIGAIPPAEQSPIAAQSVHCEQSLSSSVAIKQHNYAHAQWNCACAVHNNGQRRRVQKSDAGADEKLKINK